jgi:hypothetical protein
METGDPDCGRRENAEADLPDVQFALERLFYEREIARLVVGQIDEGGQQEKNSYPENQ